MYKRTGKHTKIFSRITLRMSYGKEYLLVFNRNLLSSNDLRQFQKLSICRWTPSRTKAIMEGSGETSAQRNTKRETLRVATSLPCCYAENPFHTSNLRKTTMFDSAADIALIRSETRKFRDGDDMLSDIWAGLQSPTYANYRDPIQAIRAVIRSIHRDEYRDMRETEAMNKVPFIVAEHDVPMRETADDLDFAEVMREAALSPAEADMMRLAATLRSMLGELSIKRLQSEAAQRDMLPASLVLSYPQFAKIHRDAQGKVEQVLNRTHVDLKRGVSVEGHRENITE